MLSQIRNRVSPRNILLLALWLLALQPWTVYAQKIAQIEFGTSPVTVGISTIVTVVLEVKSKPWCGMHVEFGDGQGQDVRVGDEGSTDGRVSLQHVYASPGQFIARAEGKFLGRGLFSAIGCDGMIRSSVLNVVDKASEEHAEEVRRQAETEKQSFVQAQTEADRAFSLKERELELKQKELEIKEKQLDSDRLKMSIQQAEADRLFQQQILKPQQGSSERTPPLSPNATTKSTPSNNKKQRPMPVLIPQAF